MHTTKFSSTIIGVFTLLVLSITSCDNEKSANDNTLPDNFDTEESVSNETSEPTLLGKWQLVNFEMDGKAKFDDCDASTVWDFSEDFSTMYQGKKLYKLNAASEDPACRLYGFNSEWEEIEEDATEVYIDNVKVGKGTNKGGTFKIEELTTKTLVLKGGNWVYSFKR